MRSKDAALNNINNLINNNANNIGNHVVNYRAAVGGDAKKATSFQTGGKAVAFWIGKTVANPAANYGVGLIPQGATFPAGIENWLDISNECHWSKSGKTFRILRLPKYFFQAAQAQKRKHPILLILQLISSIWRMFGPAVIPQAVFLNVMLGYFKELAGVPQSSSMGYAECNRALREFNRLHSDLVSFYSITKRERATINQAILQAKNEIKAEIQQKKLYWNNALTNPADAMRFITNLLVGAKAHIQSLNLSPINDADIESTFLIDYDRDATSKPIDITERYGLTYGGGVSSTERITAPALLTPDQAWNLFRSNATFINLYNAIKIAKANGMSNISLSSEGLGSLVALFQAQPAAVKNAFRGFTILLQQGVRLNEASARFLGNINEETRISLIDMLNRNQIQAAPQVAAVVQNAQPEVAPMVISAPAPEPAPIISLPPASMEEIKGAETDLTDTVVDEKIEYPMEVSKSINRGSKNYTLTLIPNSKNVKKILDSLLKTLSEDEAGTYIRSVFATLKGVDTAGDKANLAKFEKTSGIKPSAIMTIFT